MTCRHADMGALACISMCACMCEGMHVDLRACLCACMYAHVVRVCVCARANITAGLGWALRHRQQQRTGQDNRQYTHHVSTNADSCLGGVCRVPRGPERSAAGTAVQGEGGEEHVRLRLLLPVAHGRPAHGLAARPADHCRPAAGSQGGCLGDWRCNM